MDGILLSLGQSSFGLFSRSDEKETGSGKIDKGTLGVLWVRKKIG